MEHFIDFASESATIFNTILTLVIGVPSFVLIVTAAMFGWSAWRGAR